MIWWIKQIDWDLQDDSDGTIIGLGASLLCIFDI